MSGFIVTRMGGWMDGWRNLDEDALNFKTFYNILNSLRNKSS